MINLEDKESNFTKGTLIKVISVAEFGNVSTMLYQYIEHNYGQLEIGDHPIIIYSNKTAEPLLYLGYNRRTYKNRVDHFFLYQQKIWYIPSIESSIEKSKKLPSWFCNVTGNVYDTR